MWFPGLSLIIRTCSLGRCQSNGASGGQSRGGPACLCSALAAYSLAVLGVLVGFIVVRSDGEGEHTICSAPSGLRITPVLGLPPKSSSRRAGTVLALCLSTYNRAAVYGLALGSDSF